MRIFLVLCLLLQNFINPCFTECQTLEGAGAASSSSSFDAQVSVIYLMDGGIAGRHNLSSYPLQSGDHVLYEPYRFGYSFGGWYLDSGFTEEITAIPTDQEQIYIVYAKWNLKIDNYASVMDYEYHSLDSRIGENTVLLKELAFDFCEKIDIPGMPETKESDFFNQYIFSESQCPQGVCFTDEFVLITSYSTEDDCMGELMVMDRESGQYLITLGMDENSHLGGIAFDGSNVWVCNSYEGSIERISYDFIELMAYRNTGEVVDAREVVDTYSVENTPSCITYYGGRLWVATHTIVLNSVMVAYQYDIVGDQLVALSEYTIPAQVQGVTFDDSGRVYLSTSYGRNNSSYIKRYASIIALSSRPKRPEITVEMPPCSEEIDIYDDTLYVLFESAGEKYLEGTDGKGKSLSPIDQLLMIPLSEFS